MFQYDAPSAPNDPYVRDRFGLLDIPLALWRHKVLIIGLPVIFALLAAFATTLMPNRYQSTSQILIDPRELRVLLNDVSPQGLNSDSTTAYIESQARIIASTDMLRRVVDREKLTRDSEFVGMLTPLSRLFPQQEPTGDTTLRVMEQLRRGLTVRRGERTFVIDITVTSQDPEKSARIANAFAALYLEDQANVRADVNRRASSGLTARLNELRDRVRAAEDKVETYKVSKSIVGASGKLVVDEQLAAVNAQLALARSRLADARARFDQVERIRGETLERGAIPEAINSTTIGLLRQQLGEAQKRASTLATSLGPLHPDYLAAQNSLREAQRGIGDELTRIRQTARADLERAQANERTLQQQVDSLKRDTLTTSRDLVELREMERELEATRQVYQSFLQRARETSEQTQVDTTNARIITTAIPPLDKVSPARRLIVTGAAAAGLALGVFLALISEIARNTRESRLWRQQIAQARPAQPMPQPMMMPQMMPMTPAPAPASPSPQSVAMQASMERVTDRLQPSTMPPRDSFGLVEPGGSNAQPAAPKPVEPTQRQAETTAASFSPIRPREQAAPSAAPSPQDDMMRLLRMLGQLERTIDQYGKPQKA